MALTPMNGLRIFWVIWCSFWALGWLLFGLFTFFLGWLMVPVSLAAILLIMIPDRRALPAPCINCGLSPSEHWAGRCPPRPMIGPPDVSGRR